MVYRVWLGVKLGHGLYLLAFVKSWLHGQQQPLGEAEQSEDYQNWRGPQA
jgi:hypothetical protein